LVDKKTFILAVAVSWVLTLVTVLLIANFAPSLTQPFTQQPVSLNSVQSVHLQNKEVMQMEFIGGTQVLKLNFS
jgi:hypothetical protein